MTHLTHRRISRRGETARRPTTETMRERLVRLLRGKESDLDHGYYASRYWYAGHVASYDGWVIVGDELLTGYPSRGTPGMLFVPGYVTRQPLSEVPTAALARVARLMTALWRDARIEAEMVSST